MRLLRYSSAVVSPMQMRADTNWDPLDDRWYVPHPWLTELSAAGVTVTPDLAMTLSAFYSGVTMIGRDLATLPAQTFKARTDGGKDRVTPIYGQGIDASNGIGSMAYMLRWQPNGYQTATEFWLGQVAQYLLRGKAYAEIVDDPRTGFVIGLVPRHPDRITPERLPSGNLRYKLIQTNGIPRYLTQREMFVVRDLSMDGLNSLSRVQYGAQTIGTILAAEQAAGKFFSSGMTASTVVTYKGGQMDDEDEANLHTSLSRYAAGARNNFGLLVVPDEIDVKTLGIEPEKAQMMACVVPETLLSMADGTRRPAERIAVGDYVMGWNNGPVPARVASVFTPPTKAVYRITTARGRELTASYDHPVLALKTLRTPGGGPARDDPKWMYMEDLRPGMYVRVGLGVAERGTRSLSFDQGWLLGAMTGDGAIRRAGFSFTSANPSVVDKLRGVVTALGGTVRELPARSGTRARQYDVLTGGMGGRVGQIRRLFNAAQLVGKLAATKRVPDIVLTSGADAWRGFLSGYLDTDGTVQPDRNGRRALVSWTSINRALLEDCQHLLAMLHIQSAIYRQSSRKSAVIQGRLCKQQGTWQLVVVGSAAVSLLAKTILSSHSVKRARLAALCSLSPTRYRNVTVLYDRVRSVEELAAGKTIGIEIEDVHTHITNGIVTHNSREWGVREVARQLNLPGAKLGIKDSVSYNSQVQAALDYVITCLRPIAVTFEQAIQRDLILAKDAYFVEFLLAALLRGDFESQANYIEKLIRNRVLWSSEARLILNMNPDEKLDKLLENDFRPGTPATRTGAPNTADENDDAPERADRRSRSSARAQLKGVLALHDTALRCLRRERLAVEKLARKHADDVPDWQASLREFYGEHAHYVAQAMRMSPVLARAYAAQHGTEVEAKGIAVFSEEWERYDADELCLLAVSDGERIAA